MVKSLVVFWCIFLSSSTFLATLYKHLKFTFCLKVLRALKKIKIKPYDDLIKLSLEYQFDQLVFEIQKRAILQYNFVLCEETLFICFESNFFL